MRNYLESPNWVDHLLDDFKDFMSGEIGFYDVCKKIESMEAESCSGFFPHLNLFEALYGGDKADQEQRWKIDQRLSIQSLLGRIFQKISRLKSHFNYSRFRSMVQPIRSLIQSL